MNINEYSIKFRTLAAASGWNEKSLLTIYRQGLKPKLRLHLATYDDAIGVEQFIQLSIRCANRMQSCLAELTPTVSTALLRRPDPMTPPEPTFESDVTYGQVW